MADKRFELRPEHMPRLADALRESLAAGRVTVEEATDWCNLTYDIVLEHRVQAGTKKGPADHAPPTPAIPNG